MTPALATLGLLGFVTSEVLLLPKPFPNPVVAPNPPEVLGFALGRNNEGLECSLCAPQHGLLFTSYLKKQESLFPFLLSDGEAIPGSPCYGVLPLFSRRCLFMDSYNHFFSCQHYFKHKDFLCWCLSPQNNDRLQSDPWRALASLGAATPTSWGLHCVSLDHSWFHLQSFPCWCHFSSLSCRWIIRFACNSPHHTQ